MVQEDSLKFSIQEIGATSQHLKTVINLGNANSETLGFLPYGAFERLAEEGRIIGFIVPEVGCVGYLLYGISRRDYRVKLTHLCVDKNWQKRGIAKKLLQYLKNKTQHLYGILLSCRRDYNLDGMWASLGFVAPHERPGKSKEGSILTEWWLDYGHHSLLTNLAYQQTVSKLCVAIDANIFFDLVDNEKFDEEGKESKVLISDWLEAEIKLCLTDEILNEINRNSDSIQRGKLRAATSHFTLLPSAQEEFDKVCQNIRKFFPNKMTSSDASDLRQIARVITSQINAPYFITRDKRLLGIEEEIYQEFNLTIIHPIDLVLKLDQLRRENEYQPELLGGTNIIEKRIQSGEIDSIIDLFLAYSQGERKPDFGKNIRHLVSNTEQFKCFTISQNEILMALIVYDRSEDAELKIPIFRFRDTKITSTILRRCIFQCFSTAANENRQFTRITEIYLDDTTIKALSEDGFLKTESGWLRANLAISDRAVDISSYITNLCKTSSKGYDKYLPFADILLNQDLLQKPEIMADIERMLYPAKITDAEIPTYIIPIKSRWAKELFDKELAEEGIWRAKEELALRREVVYYSSKRKMKYPGRILWYVTSSPDDKNSSAILGAIRACSRLDEVTIGKPKDLYKKFRRLGIYSFQDVLKTASNNLNQEIKAVKFSDTELFIHPIKFTEIKTMLNRSIQLQSSIEIYPEEFKMLYNRGTSIFI
ncbi:MULTISPECIES: GNAT family N-acetyltransferase [unclassified Anabaena]|uniref:GNAT family N-acetyltransferase n=1 Tax=unclassified Anabaena TaxID=2619674 RepID=UPI0014478A6E|nr:MULTISPECIES: GNAT family N-acetyltransferase [unclassified Anabaena]MTJ08022.1 GNAT family N-acetyltransferase [Anabaena sp. UHCC 0204]MTJ53243.1 GNAT family N-acetyltransferase [Anabaena sp. UHCC 0253]